MPLPDEGKCPWAWKSLFSYEKYWRGEKGSAVAVQISEEKLGLSPWPTMYKCNRCLSTVMLL